MSTVSYDEFVRAFDTYPVGVHHIVRINPADEARVWQFLWNRTSNCNPRVTFASRDTHSNFIQVEFAVDHDSQAPYFDLDVCLIC
jgi:hypothetical protein